MLREYKGIEFLYAYDPFGGGYSADTMGHQSQILGNSWEKRLHKKVNL